MAASPQTDPAPPRRRALAARLQLRERVQDIVVTAHGSPGVLAACRVAGPQARREGESLAAAHFDLAALGPLAERIVEVTRMRGDTGPGTRAIRDVLWDAVAEYLLERRLDYVLCAAPVVLRGHAAAATLWRELERLGMSPDNCRVAPLRPMPFTGEPGSRLPLPAAAAEWAARGAWLCGEPALDAERDLAYVPFLLPLARMRTPRLRPFLARAA